jgi:hypothetical protein
LEFALAGAVGPKGWEINTVMKNLWDHAFGISWLALGNFTFDIGMSSDPTAIAAAAAMGLPFTLLGVGGTFALGNEKDLQVSMSGALDMSKKPPFFGFYGNLDNDFHIDKIIAWFSRVINKPVNPKNLPEIMIKKNSSIGIATGDVTTGIPPLQRTYKTGFNLLLDAMISGYEAKLSLIMDKEKELLSGDVRIGEVAKDGSLGPIKLKIDNKPIINVSDMAGTGPLNGQLVIDGKKPENDKFAFDGRLDIVPIDLVMAAKLLLDKNGFNGKFEFKVSDLFSADVEARVNPAKLDELYLMLAFQQKFQQVLIDKLKEWGNTTVKVNIDKILDDTKKILQVVKQAENYKAYLAAQEANKRHEQANRALVVCKAQYNNLGWFKKSVINTAWANPGLAIGATVILKNDLPACNILIGANVLELKSILDKTVAQTMEKITEAMEQAVTKVDEIYEKQAIDQKMSDLINSTIKLLSQAIADALSIFQVRSAKVIIDGAKLKAGQTPALSLDAELDLTSISKSIGKISLKFDDISFNFKSVPDTLKDIASKIWSKIQDPLLKAAKQLAADALRASGRPDLADKIPGVTPAASPAPESEAAQKTDAIIAASALRYQGETEIRLRKSLGKPVDKASIEAALGMPLTQEQYDSMVAQEALNSNQDNKIKQRFLEELELDRLSKLVSKSNWTPESMLKWVTENSPNLPDDAKQRVANQLFELIMNGIALPSAAEIEKAVAATYSKKTGLSESDTSFELHGRVLPRMKQVLKQSTGKDATDEIILRTINDVFDDKDNYNVLGYLSHEVKPA